MILTIFALLVLNHLSSRQIMIQATNTKQHTPAGTIPEQFRDIAPYTNAEFKQKMAQLIEEPGFEHAIRYVMPDVDYEAFVNQLLGVETQDEFQRKVMGQFLEFLVKTTTSGLTVDGLDNCAPDTAYTFITNHRDIVLDASFLNLCFIRHNRPLTQVAIGNNLLIYEWISDLVKLNRSFIVKRDVKALQALEAAKQLSSYIHYTIKELHESVWIAQREGRAKDSNDRTQESLIKMLSLGGKGSVRENIMGVNLLPVAISYEFDPNDYLKVKEFLLKRRDPNFKKSQRDDLFSMETGLLSQKGRIHFRIGECINPQLEAYDGPDDRNHVVKFTTEAIDREIHKGYYLYPCNYIAYDEINYTKQYASHYTESDITAFEEYIRGQLERVDVPDITPEEHCFMRQMILTMYANPVKNQLAALELVP